MSPELGYCLVVVACFSSVHACSSIHRFEQMHHSAEQFWGQALNSHAQITPLRIDLTLHVKRSDLLFSCWGSGFFLLWRGDGRRGHHDASGVSKVGHQLIMHGRVFAFPVSMALLSA